MSQTYNESSQNIPSVAQTLPNLQADFQGSNDPSAFGNVLGVFEMESRTRELYQANAAQFRSLSKTTMTSAEAYHRAALRYQTDAEHFLTKARRFYQNAEGHGDGQDELRGESFYMPYPRLARYKETMCLIAAERIDHGLHHSRDGIAPANICQRLWLTGLKHYQDGVHIGGVGFSRDDFRLGGQHYEYSMLLIEQSVKLFENGTEKYKEGAILIQAGERLYQIREEVYHEDRWST